MSNRNPASTLRVRQIPAHEFEAFDGATGRACTAMVEIDGFGEDCGLPPDHEKHVERCSKSARKGTGEGVCDHLLTRMGDCPNGYNHIEDHI